MIGPTFQQQPEVRPFWRRDLAGFVNGLPQVVIALKKPGVPARAAFDENLARYRERIGHLTPSISAFEAERETLFWFNATLE